jgi:hypothetical protein
MLKRQTAMNLMGATNKSALRVAGRMSYGKCQLKSLIAVLTLAPVLAGGCGRTETADQPPTAAQTQITQSAAATAGKPEETSQSGWDNSSTGQQVSADSQTQTDTLAASPSTNDVPIQYMDTRLQQALQNFPTLSNKIDRSMIAIDMGKLADTGVPKPQIASALGDLFRDENSVAVKTEILNELGNLDDPSAFDKIVRGLDQNQPDEVHMAAIEALDSLGDKRAIPLIQPYLTDRDEDVRDAAESAIDSLNDQ